MVPNPYDKIIPIVESFARQYLPGEKAAIPISGEKTVNKFSYWAERLGYFKLEGITKGRVFYVVSLVRTEKPPPKQAKD